MIALIPGLSQTLAYLHPQERQPQPPSPNFPQVLAAVTASAPAPGTSGSAVPPRYVVQPGDNLSRIARKLGYDDPLALARANRLKDPNLLQIGQVLSLPPESGVPATVPVAGKTPTAVAATVAPSASPPRRRQLVVASWYGSRHHGKIMANGQPFDMNADTAAHRRLPLGTRLTLTNPQTGQSVKVQVTDRGPYVPGRDVDLSLSAARKLGMVHSGVARLWMEGG